MDSFYNDILAQLQEGEGIDNIASMLTKALNDANSAYLEQKRKAEEEAKKAKAAKREEKVAAVEALLIACERIVDAWQLGTDLIDFLEHVDADKVVDDIDQAVDFADDLEEFLRNADTPAPKAEKPVTNKDPIDEFLNKYVRKPNK